MSLESVDAILLKRAFISGANNISNNKETINELNVFPVPDGDTGTNMTLTIMSAVAAVNDIECPTIDSLARAISGGSLRGARGNSGVILSQIFRGFCKEVSGLDILTQESIASAFARGCETAYKAVMKPKEGTILTVARAMSEKAAEILGEGDDIVEYVEEILSSGREALAETPELLPVLKEAGVVDSGGQGLVEIVSGILSGLKGEDITLNDSSTENKLARGAGLLEDIPSIRPTFKLGSGNDSISTADIKYGYCTEYIVMRKQGIKDDKIEELKEYLLSIGDSLVCVYDDDIIKIHIHTNHPGQAFEKGLQYGELTRCKVDNMREEHSERVFMASEHITINQAEAPEVVSEAQPPEKYGFVAVSAGEGLNNIFHEIGVSFVIHGGQTMNPSTDDIINAISNVNAENIFIFPNNKNIILAANQAADIIKDKKVYVIPSVSIPQGIAAMLEYNEDAEPEDNAANMTAAMQDIRSGEVTFSVRDTSIDGKVIHKNNIMGISENGIDAVGEDVATVTKALIEELIDEDSGLITLYYGEDISDEDAAGLAEELSEKYSDIDVDVRSGGQPIYYYILSVE